MKQQYFTIYALFFLMPGALLAYKYTFETTIPKDVKIDTKIEIPWREKKHTYHKFKGEIKKHHNWIPCDASEVRSAYILHPGANPLVINHAACKIMRFIVRFINYQGTPFSSVSGIIEIGNNDDGQPGYYTFSAS